ncbi:hypothetical protein H2199_007030 [Coniosporium tulheliwenetii]|uniref:Uncharacterized protein n=1 Tax=Coniosporium tulheliwenetii TaxID=3383036 RepID=A0ACC2YTI1_9PEZI|nr:hypothetical protein H2199_007030 [Cladosporium sp. JES 115]
MSGGWNTIESDAGVFTELLEKLGAKDVQFEELISLDADLLRQLSPVYGVIFLFKYPTGESPSSVPKDGTFDHSAAENIFFAAQTIQNACGTQALLSVLLNKDGEIDIGAPLRDFKEFTTAFPADSRTATADDDVYHFIAYTPINNVLYELDGLQAAPISHGPCTSDEFPEKVIPVLQRRIERYPSGEIRFNLLAVCRDLRVRAREVGDLEGLRREEAKRVEWAWENALRRHNFVGFVGELMKGVVRAKLKEGRAWVKEAVERSKKRREEGRRKGGVGDEMEV